MTRLITLNSTTIKSTTNQVDPLLILRGLACLVVVLFHCGVPRSLIVYKDYNFTWLFLGDGIVAVWVFFALSGYLMGKAFYTQRYTPTVKGLTQFFINRALRILPLYYFAILVQSIFVYPAILKPGNWEELFRVCTFTYTLPIPLFEVGNYNFNGAFWTISTEVHFYLIVPFIYTAIQPILTNRLRVLFAFFAIIIFTTIIRIFGILTWPAHTALLMNLDVFLCGFLVNALFQIKSQRQPQQFHHLSSSKLPKINGKWIAILLMIILYLVTAYHGYHEEVWNYIPRPNTLMDKSLFRTVAAYYIWPVLTGLITALFIYIFERDGGYNNTFQNQKLSLQACIENPRRILEIIGILSYGIYLWHMAIIQQILPIVQGDHGLETFSNKLFTTIILSILLSAVTYYLVEIPATRLKKYSSRL
ncbi:MAG: acyltransferase [Microcoleaceae cyanobacterium]